jgi:Holliday junction resolvase RusA-like endonuclease
VSYLGCRRADANVPELQSTDGASEKSMTTTFTVLGQPATKGSTVSFQGKNGIVTRHDCKNLAAWTQAVGWAARAARVPMAPAGAAVSISAAFSFIPPKRKRHWPTVRPDVDKLARALLDALTGVAYADDAQVVNLWVSKTYHDTAQMIVRLEVL